MKNKKRQNDKIKKKQQKTKQNKKQQNDKMGVDGEIL